MSMLFKTFLTGLIAFVHMHLLELTTKTLVSSKTRCTLIPLQLTSTGCRTINILDLFSAGKLMQNASKVKLAIVNEILPIEKTASCDGQNHLCHCALHCILHCSSVLILGLFEKLILRAGWRNALLIIPQWHWLSNLGTSSLQQRECSPRKHEAGNCIKTGDIKQVFQVFMNSFAQIFIYEHECGPNSITSQFGCIFLLLFCSFPMFIINLCWFAFGCRFRQLSLFSNKNLFVLNHICIKNKSHFFQCFKNFNQELLSIFHVEAHTESFSLCDFLFPTNNWVSQLLLPKISCICVVVCFFVSCDCVMVNKQSIKIVCISTAQFLPSL